MSNKRLGVGGKKKKKGHLWVFMSHNNCGHFSASNFSELTAPFGNYKKVQLFTHKGIWGRIFFKFRILQSLNPTEKTLQIKGEGRGEFTDFAECSEGWEGPIVPLGAKGRSSHVYESGDKGKTPSDNEYSTSQRSPALICSAAENLCALSLLTTRVHPWHSERSAAIRRKWEELFCQMSLEFTEVALAQWTGHQLLGSSIRNQHHSEKLAC